MITRGVFVAGIAALGLWAQDEPRVGMVMAYPAQQSMELPAPGPGRDVMYIRTEVGGPGKQVKGIPFSAEVVTEFTQTLADGNVIRRNQTGTLARDSEGRTRREQPLAPIGPAATPSPAARLVFINDPVAGMTYVLDTDKKTAQKLPMPKIEVEAGGGGAAGGATQILRMPEAGHVAVAEGEAGPKHRVRTHVSHMEIAEGFEEGEEAGSETKMIEGVRTVGRRTAHTIPAGEIGNDRPIETVSERWYSPDLQTVILTRHSDPRMGETVYRLTNVNRAEPAPSLFEIPADYKVLEAPQENFIFHKKVEGKDAK